MDYWLKTGALKRNFSSTSTTSDSTNETGPVKTEDVFTEVPIK